MRQRIWRGIVPVVAWIASGSGCQANPSYTLTLTQTASGTLAAAPPGPTYSAGTRVKLAATPDPGATLAAWHGTDDDTSTALTNTVTLSANKTVSATFAAAFTLTLNAGTGGTLTAAPTGPSYASGTKVTLTATPSPGFKVTAWSGSDDDSSTAATNTITMTADKTVSVSFASTTAPSYTLTLSPGANGTLAAAPPGPSFAAGTVVALTATPSAGYQVAKWTGSDSDSSTAATNNVTMTANKTVSVTFAPLPTYTLTLTLTYTAAQGAVAASPTGPSYASGTRITLTATPALGYLVAGWAGTDEATSTASVAHVTMTGNKSVTVTFMAVPTYALTLDPATHGTLTASPSSATYTSGTVVTLTAAGDLGYKVLAWSGTDNDAATAATNQVTMSAAKEVSVTFQTAPIHTLTLTAPTHGTLTADPPGRGTGTQYTEGAVVTLTATPDANYVVAGWTGTANDSSTATTNSVTLSADKGVSVTLVQAYTLTINNTSAWCHVTATVGGITVADFSDLSASIQEPDTTTVHLHAVPIPGFQPVVWTGTTTQSGADATYDMTTAAGQSLTADCPP